MDFVPFTNTVEVIIRFTLFGVPVAIVIGGINGGGISPTNQAALGSALDTWRKTYIQPITANALIATDIKVYDLTSPSSPVTTTLATSPTAGAVNSGLAAQTAQVTTFNTGKRGRSYRGRNYFPGLVYANIADPDHWSAGSTLAVLGVYAQLASAMAGAGFGHAVLSRRANNALRTLGVATPVSNYSTTGKIETQRRRLG